MDIIGQVGEAAGEIWRVLDEEGPQTLAQLRKKLKGQGDLLLLGAGWLAREDKLQISKEKKTITIQLKG